MKTITWITPTFFIDVDNQIVPYLSKTYKIHWIIVGGHNKPSIYKQLEKVTKKYNIEFKYYTISGKWYMPNQYFKYKKLFGYILSLSSDLIYVDSSLTFWKYYAALHTLPKEKTILATHNVKTPKGARLEHFVRYFMKQTLKNFKNFHVFSMNQKEYLEKLVKGRNVLYAPLTLKDYGEKGNRTKYKNRINFLSFGHIRQYKRIDLLIDAAQQLYKETDIPFKVTIAGNCPQWGEYQSLIKYPELFDLKIGFIKDEEVANYFANADYLVLPYQDLAQSGAITVAFNYNVPVITSDIIQFREFVHEGENGFMFQSENVNDLKRVLLNALHLGKSAKYNSLVQSTASFVQKNYVLSSIANKYIKFFNQF